MSAHSPGPWRRGSSPGSPLIVDANGGPVAMVSKWIGTGEDSAPRAADARLIAAAPELLEELRCALGAVDALKYDPGGVVWSELEADVERAVALIRRIEGDE